MLKVFKNGKVIKLHGEAVIFKISVNANDKNKKISFIYPKFFSVFDLTDEKTNNIVPTIINKSARLNTAV